MVEKLLNRSGLGKLKDAHNRRNEPTSKTSNNTCDRQWRCRSIGAQDNLQVARILDHFLFDVGVIDALDEHDAVFFLQVAGAREQQALVEERLRDVEERREDDCPAGQLRDSRPADNHHTAQGYQHIDGVAQRHQPHDFKQTEPPAPLVHHQVRLTPDRRGEADVDKNILNPKLQHHHPGKHPQQQVCLVVEPGLAERRGRLHAIISWRRVSNVKGEGQRQGTESNVINCAS